MAAITRSRLARGAKLDREHVYTPLTSAATELAAGIEREQMEAPHAPFRLNFHVPFLDGAFFDAFLDATGTFMIPFTLPPTQDFFDDDGQVSSTTPDLLLDELSISFDQRCESAGIRTYSVGAARGNLDYDNVNSVFFRLRLMEKTMLVFDAAAPLIPEREILSVNFSADLWNGDDLKQNPFILTNIGKVLHPYRTYVIMIDPQINRSLGITTAVAGEDLALVALQISLRLRSILVPRDTGSEVQNAPQRHLMQHAPAVVTIQTPAFVAGVAAIEANTATGVQTNVGVIDAVFANKLAGGMTEESDISPAEHIEDDAAYEVIVVPMFPLSESVTAANIARLPYVGAAPYTAPTCDRADIPIKFPFVLHHVIAVLNWADSPAATNLKPVDANFVTDIDVGIMTGARADDYGYQRLAYATFTPATKDLYLLDRIKERIDGTMSDGDYDQEMLLIPTVYAAAGPFGNSYDLTAGGVRSGPPIFIGRSNSATENRSGIATLPGGAAGQSAIEGKEQFIECRWRFGDSATGLGDAASYPATTVFCGFGYGGLLYLIGKKHLA